MNSSSQASGSGTSQRDISKFPAIKNQIDDAMKMAVADGLDRGDTLLFLMHKTIFSKGPAHEAAKEVAWEYCKDLSNTRPAKNTRSESQRCSASLVRSYPAEADGLFPQDESDKEEGMLARIRSAPAGHVA